MTDPTLTAPDHVIFHAGCPDGVTAAAILRRRWPGVEIHRGVYQQARPLGLHGHVVLVDFSYPPDELWAIVADPTVERVTLLDHHDTAIRQLGLLGRGTVREDYDAPFDYWLDPDHSGAMLALAWTLDDCVLDPRYGLPGALWHPQHDGWFGWLQLARYVEDRDLWRFTLPDSREIVAAINATPQQWPDWDLLADQFLGHHGGVDRMVQDGAAILRRDRVLIDQIVATARPIDVLADEYGTLPVPMVGCAPYGLGSDVAGELAATSDSLIGGYYIDRPDARQFGLRSTPDGPNVAEIAERVGAPFGGGGGHPHAAGFTIPRTSGHSLLVA